MGRLNFGQSTTGACLWKRFRFLEGKIRTTVFLLATIMLAGPLSLRVGRAEQHTKSPVYVILWLDTEDYISPPSDDSAKRLAEFLTQQDIRATFKVVGEKARTLQRRGRQDVIWALARHEIGFHSNFHSRHPIVEEYEEPLDWNDGVPGPQG